MKKLLAVFIALLGVLFINASASALLYGDVNSDGRVTASDARLILRHAASVEFLTDASAADLNSDGRITAADARKALRIASLLEKPENKENISVSAGTAEKPLTAKEVYEKASDFTAEIITYKENGAGLSVGTCFFIDENKVVTNYHVINSAHFAKIKIHNGGICDVTRVLGFDKSRDIAILEVDYKASAAASAGAAPEVGDVVYALGSTKGYTGTFTSGIVSCSSRVIAETGNGVQYIQFTAPVSEGNSGGPLLDAYGNVTGIVTLTDEAGQNLNFALPVSEIEKTDISSPCTLAELSSKASAEDFEGEIALSVPALTLKKGGCALVYALVSASDEYNLTCETDNKAIIASMGRAYGNVNVIYVSASEANVSGTVKVYMEGHKECFAILDVTTGDDAPVVYPGINGFVPDFGALTGVIPSECDENTLDGKNAYSFAYSFESLNNNGVNRDNAIEDYRALLEENGYVYLSAAQGNSGVIFYSNESKTTVTLGVTTDDNGKYYIFVLIVK